MSGNDSPPAAYGSLCRRPPLVLLAAAVRDAHARCLPLLLLPVVPTYKPGFALALFTKFINNEEF